jgi:hypothetical protein
VPLQVIMLKETNAPNFAPAMGAQVSPSLLFAMHGDTLEGRADTMKHTMAMCLLIWVQYFLPKSGKKTSLKT